MDLISDEARQLLPLAVSLAVGMIIGFERGWSGQVRAADGSPTSAGADGNAVAGIRTFSLVGLLGGIVALLAQQVGSGVLLVAFLALGLLLTAGYVLTTWFSRDFGATTEIAMLLTFALGALAGNGSIEAAVAAAVVTAVILGFREEIHTTLGRLNRTELHASLQLLVIALVVLPLLPDRAIGPGNGLNPRTIGLLVMLIAGIGFVGYFAVRILGARAGLLVTAVLGAITSSTAVTVSFARLAVRMPRRAPLLGAGIALASGIMGIRVLIEVAVVNAALLPALWPGIAALAVVPVVAAIIVARREESGADVHEAGVSNPLEVRQALVMAGVLALVFLLVDVIGESWGESGLYVLAALSGIADVDAIALALAEQARTTLAPEVATRAILVAALVNTAAKAVLAAVIGGWRLARWASSILLAALGVAALMGFVWLV